MWSERQQGLGEEAGRGKGGSRVSLLSLPALRIEGGKTERSSIVEEGAAKGKGNDASFPVFCWIRICKAGLYNEGVLQFAVAVGWIHCICSLHLHFQVPAGVLCVSSLSPLWHVLWHCVPRALCLHGTVFSAHHGRADCASQERPHHPLLPSLLSLCNSLGLWFLLLLLLPKIFLSSYGCLPFFSLLTPKLFLLQSCPIW